MRLNVQHIFLALCKKNTNCFRFVWVPSHIWFYIIYVLAFPLVICHIHNKITLNETKACMQTSFDWELKIHTQIFCATGSHEEMKSTKNIQRSLEKEWWKNSNAFPWSIFSNNFQEKCVSNSTSKSDPLILRIRTKSLYMLRQFMRYRVSSAYWCFPNGIIIEFRCAVQNVPFWM